MTSDELRTAALLFGTELAQGIVTPEQLSHPQVRDAVRSRPVPSPPRRVLQALRQRRGTLTYARSVVAPMMAARRAVLADAAHGAPRVLLRVDEFPHVSAWDDPATYGTPEGRRFHEILTGAGVPYLMAVTPRVPRNSLDPQGTEARELDAGERELLAQMHRDGVTFAVHGLDHRTRHANPRQHSEFTGLSQMEVEARLDAGLETLRAAGLPAPVFVPPFNRFDAASWTALAQRFEIVCGGPENVRQLGFHATPSWRNGAVWLPSYAPVYGTAERVLSALRELTERRTALWVPVVLHWGWERDYGWEGLRELCAFLSETGIARPWDEFLTEVRASGEHARRAYEADTARSSSGRSASSAIRAA